MPPQCEIVALRPGHENKWLGRCLVGTPVRLVFHLCMRVARYTAMTSLMHANDSLYGYYLLWGAYYDTGVASGYRYLMGVLDTARDCVPTEV